MIALLEDGKKEVAVKEGTFLHFLLYFIHRLLCQSFPILIVLCDIAGNEIEQIAHFCKILFIHVLLLKGKTV